jgi:cytochrome b561
MLECCLICERLRRNRPARNYDATFNAYLGATIRSSIGTHRTKPLGPEHDSPVRHETSRGDGKGIGTMTATHKGISGMRLENKAPGKQSNKVTFMHGADVHLDKTPHQPAEETVIARPRKLVFLHWLTVLCLCFAAALILIRDQVDGRVMQQWLLEGHRHFGLFVLILFFVRVVVRIRLGKLPSADNSSRLVHALASLTHIALYALLLALPLLGWALSDALGKPVHLFGATLPALVGSDDDLADTLQTWHVDAAWVLLGLVSLHIGAALWHHFVMRDGVLRLMWPKRRR